MSIFEYSRWDGSQNFTPLSAEQAFDKISEYLLEHGEYVLRQLERSDMEDSDLLKYLIKEQYLEKDEGGQLAMGARGLKRVEQKALEELFQIVRRDAPGKHPTDFKGAGQVRHEDSKPYEFGDPVANLNLHETIKNAFVRQSSTPEGVAKLAGAMDRPADADRSPGKPLIDLIEDDFVVYESEYQTSCATVLLIDMSGSMARYGKYYSAKKVALALSALMKARYTEDSLKIIGFYSYASPLTERQLMMSAPKPVTIFDSRVFLRVPLDNPPEFVPEHFTNIQAGLRFARQHLTRTPAANKQIICVTDGEPTAHLEGRDLVLAYPPNEKTARHTLEEAQQCARAGITVSTFALIEDYFYLGLVNFVDQMARVCKGVSVYCNAGDLGSYVLEGFVKGRRSRKRMG